MIVERMFHYPKPGRRSDLVKLLKADKQQFPPPHGSRVYSHNTGCSAPVSQDFEFESHEERGKFWADWWVDPGTSAFLEKYNKISNRYYTNELWTLEE